MKVQLLMLYCHIINSPKQSGVEQHSLSHGSLGSGVWVQLSWTLYRGVWRQQLAVAGLWSPGRGHFQVVDDIFQCLTGCLRSPPPPSSSPSWGLESWKHQPKKARDHSSRTEAIPPVTQSCDQDPNTLAGFFR